MHPDRTSAPSATHDPAGRLDDGDAHATTTRVGDQLDRHDADTALDTGSRSIHDDHDPTTHSDRSGSRSMHDDHDPARDGHDDTPAAREVHDVHDFGRVNELRRWDAGTPQQEEAIREEVAREVDVDTPVRPDPAAANAAAVAALFPADRVEDFRGRWKEIQVGFVDDPRTSVQGADELVSEVMRTLAETFESSKRDLEGQWRRDGDVETEDLRLAMHKYRSFFDQLLRL